MCSAQQRYPGVEVRLHDGEQQELVQGLTDGRFDLTIFYEHDLDSTIETEPLMPPPRPYALLPEGHRFAGQTQLSLRDLALEPTANVWSASISAKALPAPAWSPPG